VELEALEKGAHLACGGVKLVVLGLASARAKAAAHVLLAGLLEKEGGIYVRADQGGSLAEGDPVFIT
jgi:hypothetical protein